MKTQHRQFMTKMNTYNVNICEKVDPGGCQAASRRRQTDRARATRPPLDVKTGRARAARHPLHANQIEP